MPTMKIISNLIKINFFLVLLIVNFCLTSNAYAYNLWGSSQKQPQHQQIQHKQSFWYDLRSHFRLNHYTYRPEVRKQIYWFQKHPGYLYKILDNAAPYMYYIYTQVSKRHLPGELVLLPIIESAYNPIAYSNRGAAGLWQLMPGTATGYGVKIDWWYDGRRDIYSSTNVALDYFTYLENFFNNNWLYILASYDAGEGTVQQAIEHNAKRGRSTSFWSLDLSNETQHYVPRLLALATIISNPNEYGIKLPPIADHPYFAAVDIGTQIDLAHAAKLAGISLKQLYQLNPGFNRWATDPNGPYRILLPIDKIAEFKRNLAKMPVNKRVTWHRYHVRTGDTLGRIANRFKTRVALLQEINKVNGNIIHPGQLLLIPRNAKDLHNYSFATELTYVKQHQLKIGPKRIIETVHVGDSLWKYAKKYNLKESQIRFWNHLSPHQPLVVGQKLMLWLPRHTRVPENLHDKKIDLYRDYKVAIGDTLGKIARHFKVSVKKIKQASGLNTDIIHVGQLLKIPPETVVKHAHRQAHSQARREKITHYKVRAGDTLDKIATHYHVKAKDLRKWNQAYLDKYLHVGQDLVIYR